MERQEEQVRSVHVMEISKIRELGEAELRQEELKAAEQLFRIRFGLKMGGNEGVRKLRELKKDVARIKTVARERALAEQKGQK